MFQINQIINRIDLNHNGIIDSNKELKLAQTYGINASMGENIKTAVEHCSKDDLQERLAKIDQSQTVDNKNRDNGTIDIPQQVPQTQDTNNQNTDDYMRRKRFNAIG